MERCAADQRKCRYPAGIPRRSDSEFGDCGKIALIRAPEGAVGDPNFLKEIPRPTPLRLRLDDDRLTFFSDKHFRSVEPIIFWQSNRLRPACGKQFGRIHVDTVSITRCLIKLLLNYRRRTASLRFTKAEFCSKGLFGHGFTRINRQGRLHSKAGCAPDPSSVSSVASGGLIDRFVFIGVHSCLNPEKVRCRETQRPTRDTRMLPNPRGARWCSGARRGEHRAQQSGV